MLIFKEVSTIKVEEEEELNEGVNETVALTNNIKVLVDTRGDNISEFSRNLGISYTTAFQLYHNKTKQITFDLMERLCAYFGVGPSELFPYIPNKKK